MLEDLVQGIYAEELSTQRLLILDILTMPWLFVSGYSKPLLARLPNEQVLSRVHYRANLHRSRSISVMQMDLGKRASKNATHFGQEPKRIV